MKKWLPAIAHQGLASLWYPRGMATMLNFFLGTKTHGCLCWRGVSWPHFNQLLTYFQGNCCKFIVEGQSYQEGCNWNGQKLSHAKWPKMIEPHENKKAPLYNQEPWFVLQSKYQRNLSEKLLLLRIYWMDQSFSMANSMLEFYMAVSVYWNRNRKTSQEQIILLICRLYFVIKKQTKISNMSKCANQAQRDPFQESWLPMPS